MSEEVLETGERVARGLDGAHGPLSDGWTDAREELHHAEGGDGVTEVLRPAQDAERILHVRCLQELEPTELHERDVAPRELDLECVRVVCGPEEDGLILQRRASLALGEHLGDDVIHLRLLVGGGDEARTLATLARRKEILGEPLGGQPDHSVRGIQHGLRRSVVLLESDDSRRRREGLREVEDVAHRRRSKRPSALPQADGGRAG